MSLAVGACARQPATNGYSAEALSAANAELVQETADLSCTQDSQCQWATVADGPDCNDQHFLFYSTKNVSSEEVYRIVTKIAQLTPKPEDQVCPLIQMLPGHTPSCVKALCQ